MTNYLDLMPEEILNIIYKFVNDDIIKDLKGNHGKNTYRPIYQDATLSHMFGNLNINKIFNGLRKTNYNDGHIIRDYKYGRAFSNAMENHYISGYIVKNTWAVNFSMVGEDEFDLSWADGEYFDDICNVLNLPVFRVNDLLRYTPVLLSFKKEKLPKREGGKVVYDLNIIYANKNGDYDSALESDFSMMVKYRFDYRDTLKNKPVQTTPYEMVVKFPIITRTERYAWSADHFNERLICRRD